MAVIIEICGAWRMTAYEKFLSLDMDSSLISLEKTEGVDCFCYPTNTKAIGFEGSIMYCFIDGYGETVFACNPESCADIYVYPLAKNFNDFIRLILACGSANPIEQIVWMNKQQFEQHLQDEKEIQTAEQKEVLSILEKELHIIAMEYPFEYVKELQSDFDYSKIQFSDEYYDVLGLER